MSKYVFLYKENDSNDRDCVAYVELKSLKEKRLCIDGKINVHGACYSSSLGGRYNNPNYEDITTILTEKEFNALCNPDERDWTNIIEKLQSEDNQELFDRIIEEEKEYMMEEYSLDEEEIEKIFNEYYLDYRDRGIIGCVFSDAYDCGYEEAWGCGYIDDKNEVQKRYFDFERFGQDLADEDERYLELDDGRIVVLNY